MGCFSWLYSDTGKPIYIGEHKDTYLLVPPPFQAKYGTAIKETCYDGYGHFGGYDVFELLAEWNRGYIPTVLRQMDEGKPKLAYLKYFRQYAETGEVPEIVYNENRCIVFERRYLGIELFYGVPDLQFPLKFVETEVPYEAAEKSEDDPGQGCR